MREYEAQVQRTQGRCIALQMGLNDKSKPFDLLSDSCVLEATTGFEPVIRVLQTLALPLGHVAV
jgi:hypothetical protein